MKQRRWLRSAPVPWWGVTVVYGPLTSQMLADYGAYVIEIEFPQGDSRMQVCTP